MADAEIIELSCNHCGRTMRMKKELLFKRGLCNYCGKKMTLPAELQQAIDEKKRPDPEAQIPIDVECPICSREFTLKKSQKSQLFPCSYCRCIFVVPENSGIARIANRQEALPKMPAPLNLELPCPACAAKPMTTIDTFGALAQCGKCAATIELFNYPLDSIYPLPEILAGTHNGRLAYAALRGRLARREVLLSEAMYLLDILSQWENFRPHTAKAFSPFSPEFTSRFLSFTVLPDSKLSRMGGKPYLTVKWYDETAPSTDKVVYEALRTGANLIGRRYVRSQFEDDPRYWCLQLAFSPCEGGCDYELFVKSPKQKITPAPPMLATALREELIPAYADAVQKWHLLQALFSIVCGYFEFQSASDAAILRRLQEVCGLDRAAGEPWIPLLKLDPPIELAYFRGHTHG